MSESTSITSKLRLEGLDKSRASIIVATTLGLLLLSFVYERVIRWYKLRKFTTINDCGIFDLFSRRAKANFAKNARSLIEEGFAQVRFETATTNSKQGADSNIEQEHLPATH